jgi:hypothetical protein
LRVRLIHRFTVIRAAAVLERECRFDRCEGAKRDF